MKHAFLNPQLESLLLNDKHHLEETKYPIVTVSSTFREDLKQYYGLEHDPNVRDIVFSRAHYSMALGVAVQAWKTDGASFFKRDPKRAWLADPTNYVQAKDWAKVESTELIGRTLARNPVLKWIKDQVDTIARNKLPLTSAITPSLLYLFQSVDRPIISMHYEAGNILGSIGKKVVQVLTDPHVREQYLTYAHLPNMRYCVFDEKTKSDFLEKAAFMNKDIDPTHIVVTGPPIDPRIVKAREQKTAGALRKRPLRICVTTGGLGTNKQEVKEVLEQLLDLARMRPSPIQILCYAGTQHDFHTMIEHVAEKEHVAIDSLENGHARLRLIHGKHIVRTNEQLITYGFPWADGFITKPSGDMAYDAASAGCFLLFLSPWGPWEKNIQNVFEQEGIGRMANVDHIKKQVSALQQQALHENTESWFEHAQELALKLPNLFLKGSKNILEVADSF